MKCFAAIEFKQKWIMPFCSPTHLASAWYWTLRPLRLIYDCQIGWWTSNILISLGKTFRSFFLLPKNKCYIFGLHIRSMSPHSGKMIIRDRDHVRLWWWQFSDPVIERVYPMAMMWGSSRTHLGVGILVWQIGWCIVGRWCIISSFQLSPLKYSLG